MADDKQLTAPEPRMMVVSPGRPAYPTMAKAAFGVTPGDWIALVDAVFPAAKTTEGVVLALSYCRARKLDPFKRPVHIVPIWDSKKGVEVEGVWPGIGELRTTASRTGLWAGNDEAVFGPDETRTFKGRTGKGQYEKDVEKTVTFPLWCQMTQYKIVQGVRCAFPGPKVLWLETYSTLGKTDVPNDMWETRPSGQLEKCAEAASLRRAFPEEIGNDYIPEEVGRKQVVNVTPDQPAFAPGSTKSERLAEKLSATAAAIEVEASAAATDWAKAAFPADFEAKAAGPGAIDLEADLRPPGGDDPDAPSRPDLAESAVINLRARLKAAGVQERVLALALDARPGNTQFREQAGATSLDAVEGDPGELQADLFERAVVELAKLGPPASKKTGKLFEEGAK